ncbi:alkyl hydroperoxide reductase [marine bacterium AO1-C]|nr:alkyl hydroperoxide reductase [marine bacterium AO1-C]
MNKLLKLLPILLITLALIIGFNACGSKGGESQTNNDDSTKDQSTVGLATGIWRATVKTPGGDLPFQLDVAKEGENYKAHIVNGEERILLDEIEFPKPDSVKITLHIFDAFLVGKITEGKSIQGIWIKNGLKEPYEVEFKAEHGKDYRFEPVKSETSVDYTGKWEVTFTEKDGKTYPSIGIFKQTGRKVSGTFLTTTGDYRYLEGQVNDKDELMISAFDGNHAFLFKATQNENKIKGEFWYGKSVYETWEGVKNEDAKLADANKLTYLKKGYDKLAFSFPNMEGKKVTLEDSRYKDKVVLVQIFGTWCPNCMDETAFLAPWYEKNKDRGVEIIGLAYERSPEFEKAKVRINKMVKRYKTGYEFLFAGINDKKEAAKTLPMLNHVLSFPTTIFIDRTGKVRKIHTGFNGPGTGKYYEEFKKDFNKTMEELIAEKATESAK